MARLDPTPYPLPPLACWGAPAGPDLHTKAFEGLLAASHALPEGEVVGAMLRWQRADGYAWYRVSGAAPLSVQHVPAHDAWTVEPALIRGLSRADVLSMIDRERRLAALSTKNRH